MPTPLTVKTFSSTGDSAQHPWASITVEPGYKILCGGAAVSPLAGNFLTASYPTSIFTWTALSKDQDTPTPATITVYAIALHDPNDKYDVQIFSAYSGEPADFVTASVTLPAGYQLVGGGAQANWSKNGQFLISSAPLLDLSGWQARCRAHLHSDPGTLTVFAVGLRNRMSGAAAIPTKLFSDPSDSPASNAQADVGVGIGYTLIGGGAIGGDSDPIPPEPPPFPFPQQGNMLTASYPQDHGSGEVEWQVDSHDQGTVDPEIITAYAIGAQLGT